MAANSEYDAVIIGGGHNGLTCAGYLARCGLKVKVLERRHVVGGSVVTEEFHPGYRNSSCAFVVSLLQDKIVRELELGKYGLRVIDRAGGTFAPLRDGGYLSLPRDKDQSVRNISRFSEKDASLYHEFHNVLKTTALTLRSTVLETAPNIGGGLRDLFAAGKIGNRVRKLDHKHRTAFADLMTMSVGDYLNKWFEFDNLKGVYAFEGVVGHLNSPYAPGSAYVLMHKYFGEVNGTVGAWGHAMGGMGSITQAMAKSAEAKGVDIQLNASVKEISIEKGVARGVVLEDGTVIRSRTVAGGINPKLLYLKLLDTSALDSDFVKGIEDYRCKSGTFRMNVALDELPVFDGLKPGEGHDLLTGTIEITHSIDYLEQAYDDAKRGAWAKEPIISLCLPSLVDNTLAPEGKHVASIFCQHFHPELSDGRSWDDAKHEAAELIVDTVTKYAPNFKKAIIGRSILSPLDLERDFSLPGGDIFHGNLNLDQIYSLRPLAGYANYRSPVKGLYLCGAGAHPGGGVSGAPGHNAAHEIIRDIKGGPFNPNRIN